jgi:hypothetical protein
MPDLGGGGRRREHAFISPMLPYRLLWRVPQGCPPEPRCLPRVVTTSSRATLGAPRERGYFVQQCKMRSMREMLRIPLVGWIPRLGVGSGALGALVVCLAQVLRFSRGTRPGAFFHPPRPLCCGNWWH